MSLMELGDTTNLMSFFYTSSGVWGLSLAVSDMSTRNDRERLAIIFTVKYIPVVPR